LTGQQALGLLAAWLIAAIPFGLLAGLAMGVDVRRAGSGNIGATNVIRVVGAKLGVIVFLLDVSKGWVGVMIGRWLGMEGWMLATVALVVVMGHSFSPYLAFKGGKGVATALGALIGINPLSALICFLVWFVVVGITRYVSLGSVIGVIPAPVLVYLLAPSHNAELAVGVIPLILLIIGRHSENIERLMKGEENRFGAKKPQPEAAAGEEPPKPAGPNQPIITGGES